MKIIKPEDLKIEDLTKEALIELIKNNRFIQEIEVETFYFRTISEKLYGEMSKISEKQQRALDNHDIKLFGILEKKHDKLYNESRVLSKLYLGV